MSDVWHAPMRPAAEPTVKAGHFDPVSIALHWMTAVLMLGQFASAWLLDSVGGGTSEHMLLTTHRSMGVLTWVVVVARLIWRHSGADLPPFPASMPRLQQRMARVNEYALYVVLILQPLTGLADTLFRGRPFDLLAWQVPAFLTAGRPLAHLLHEAHEFGANALMALIGMHIAAALLHGLILRDGVLQRMLPSRFRMLASSPEIVPTSST